MLIADWGRASLLFAFTFACWTVAASLLGLKDVRDELRAADVVVPSLDAALPPVWKRVNRPMPSFDLERIIEGLEAFRKTNPDIVLCDMMMERIDAGSRTATEIRKSNPKVPICCWEATLFKSISLTSQKKPSQRCMSGAQAG